MNLHINGIPDYGYGPCTDCIFGLMIHEIVHCLGANYHADVWLPYPVAPPDLIDGAPWCSATSATDPVSGCAEDQGDPYDPLSWPSQTTGSQSQASSKWSYGWIRDDELHVASGADLFNYGSRIDLALLAPLIGFLCERLCEQQRAPQNQSRCDIIGTMQST